MLARQPGIGRRREELQDGIRSFPVGRYLVFYLVIPDGIGHTYADNRDCRGRLLGRADSRRSQSDNGINSVLDQLLRQLAELLHIAICEFTVKRDILSFDITKLAQCQHERVDSIKTCIGFIAATKRKDAYPGNLRRLLGMRGERPGRHRAAE